MFVCFVSILTGDKFASRCNLNIPRSWRETGNSSREMRRIQLTAVRSATKPFQGKSGNSLLILQNISLKSKRSCQFCTFVDGLVFPYCDMSFSVCLAATGNHQFQLPILKLLFEFGTWVYWKLEVVVSIWFSLAHLRRMFEKLGESQLLVVLKEQ